MKYVNLSILLFCIGAYIYYVNNSHLTRKDIIFTNIFNGVSLFFVGLMIYFVVMYGFNKGLYHTLLSWCIFVVATPIPEAGLIISVPLKNLLNIQLDYTQLFVSLFALIYIVYSYITVIMDRLWAL